MAALCACTAAPGQGDGQRGVVLQLVFLPVAFALRATVFYRLGVLRFGSLAVALVGAWRFVQRAFDLAPG